MDHPPISQQVAKPTLLLDVRKARQHVQKMAARAAGSDVALRPHFKTHQSAVIGDWFRAHGVTAITVSSVDMAVYFASHGWDDVTIAFPVNLRQIELINDLAQRIKLHLLLDSADVAGRLNDALSANVHVWLEIDAGYGRSGLPWPHLDEITAVARAMQESPRLQLAGLLTHAGDSYSARGKEQALAVYGRTLSRLKSVQAHLREQGIETAVSIGDTPGCTLVEQFEGVDEIRPGNFIFYDLMQAQIGACSLEDVAVALACPVVGVYPQRNQIVLYGGAVHLSKEQLLLEDGQVSYGRIAHLTQTGWQATGPENYVVGLSQEHSIVQADSELLRAVQPGDLLLVLPVHSCLTANLMRRYLTLDGDWIGMM